MPFLPANGTGLHYIQIGEGTDVVLVHGLASSLAFWYSGFALPLKRNYRVTAYDLRGHGRSEMPPAGYTHAGMADDLLDLTERLNLGRFHLVGHSYGGLISATFAMRYPERLRSLTLADVPIRKIGRNWISAWPRVWKTLREMGRNISDDEPYPEIEVLEQIARLQAGGRIAGDGLSGLYMPYKGGKGSGKTAKRWLELLETTTARSDIRTRNVSLEEMGKITVPTLVTYGMQSQWKPSDTDLTVLLKHRVVFVKNAGHAHPWERPGDLLSTWSDFIVTLEKDRFQPGREQRAHGRFEMRTSLEFRVDEDRRWPAQTVNVSMSGLLIVSPELLEIGSEVAFNVNGEGRERHEIRGRVVRQDGAITLPHHRYGIEFIGDDQAARTLEGWVRDLQSRFRNGS